MDLFGKSKWLKPGLYTTFDKVSVVLLGLINFLILARMLPKGEFGVWVLFTTLVSLLEIMREGFIKNSFIAHFASCDPLKRDRIASASFFLNAVYSVGISALLLVVAVPLENFWSASQLSALLKIYVITNLIFVPFSHYEYVQQSVLEFKGIFFSHLTRSAIPAIFIVIFFVSGSVVSLPLLAWIMLAAHLAGAMVSVFYGMRFGHRYVRPEGKIIRDIFDFGRFTFGSNLSSLVVRNTDSWMLGRIISMEAVAAYNPAIRVANLVEIPTLTAANLAFPKLAEHYNKDNPAYVRWLYERSLGFVMAITVPALLVMFFFSDWIVIILAGKKYAEYGYLLQITAFYCLFIPFARQFGILLEAMRKPQIGFVFMLASAIINIVLNYIFIIRFGVAGAAYATLCTYLIRFVVQQFVLHKMFNVNTARIFKYAYSFYAEGYTMLKTMVARYG